MTTLKINLNTAINKIINKIEKFESKKFNFLPNTYLKLILMVENCFYLVQGIIIV